jgi:hypothetical protein
VDHLPRRIRRVQRREGPNPVPRRRHQIRGDQPKQGADPHRDSETSPKRLREPRVRRSPDRPRCKDPPRCQDRRRILRRCRWWCRGYRLRNKWMPGVEPLLFQRKTRKSPCRPPRRPPRRHPHGRRALQCHRYPADRRARTALFRVRPRFLLCQRHRPPCRDDQAQNGLAAKHSSARRTPGTRPHKVGRDSAFYSNVASRPGTPDPWGSTPTVHGDHHGRDAGWVSPSTPYRRIHTSLFNRNDKA